MPPAQDPQTEETTLLCQWVETRAATTSPQSTPTVVSPSLTSLDLRLVRLGLDRVLADTEDYTASLEVAVRS